MYQSAKHLVKEAAKGLAVDETVSLVCPFCEEDWKMQRKPITWKPERSCSVTRTNVGILHHCFRASCNHGSGFITTDYIDSLPKQKKFTPKEYNYDTRFPEGEDLEYLRRFEFTIDTCKEYGIRYNPSRHSYVFDIHDWRGYTIGVVDRDFHNRRNVKAISYWFNEVVKLHFTPVRGDTCIIVEDIPSAIKADHFLPAVALQGTGLNTEQVNFIKKLYSNIIIAFDSDATAKAVSLRNKYSLYFYSITVLPLDKDIKDTSYYELNEMFYLLLGE